MGSVSKRMRLIKEQVVTKEPCDFLKAIDLLKAQPALKFVSSVEVGIHVNINPKKSDQTVRGVVVLPHGTGRKTRVFVISEDKEKVASAIEKGAERAGFEELVNEIKQGELKLTDRDTLIATPAAMRLLMPLGQMLGPKGLMPNPKLGTVTEDVDAAVQNALLGRISYRNDKGGVVRCLIGKLSFESNALQENLQALLSSITHNKPEAAPKGKNFVKKVALSSTMGPELIIQQASLEMDAVA